MSDEATRKKAYSYVAALIVYDAEVFVEDPDMYTEVIKIRDALRAASSVPTTQEELPMTQEELPF